MSDRIEYVISLALAEMRALHGIEFSREDIFGPQRQRMLTRVRRWIWYLAYYHPALRWSYPIIGRHFNRDHTTVLYHVHLIRERMKDGLAEADRAVIARICEKMRGHFRVVAVEGKNENERVDR